MNTPILYLYNTLSRQVEEFKSIQLGKAGLYTCGPTVYNYAHLGNLRTYLFEDFLKRTLVYNGYEVVHVMNITDVGHLTGDADMGQDKLELGAEREGKTAWEIAEFYAEKFKQDLALLNIKAPSIWCKATDYIAEQIEMIKTLEGKGFTYATSDGVYFDTSKIENYNKLSHLPLDDLREGARVEVNEEKKNPTDFALWKFSTPGVKRQMEWPSPWGVGFPGWHIECSAMSLKLLEGELDIHCGGIDHINIHHTNEIAQSEAATGEKFFNYWLHGAFLNIAGGKKMAKSDDNFLTLENALLKKNINPLAYRLAALGTHYRKPMEYGEETIKNAENSLKALYRQVADLGGERGGIIKEFKEKFLRVINDDLNMPQALAVVHEVLKSEYGAADKLATLLDFDRVLGLQFNQVSATTTEALPAEILQLQKERDEARAGKDWSESDRLRLAIEDSGYLVEDTKEGTKILKK